MKVRHITHKVDEWFEVVDSDPDCDFETGQYVGINDMVKLSDGKWYPQNECVYMDADGIERQCV